jgi:hypothetical protein
MLAAENSAVMAQEHDDGGSLRPQAAKSGLLAFRIGQSDARQAAAE